MTTTEETMMTDIKCDACNGSKVELINGGNGSVIEEKCSVCLIPDDIMKSAYEWTKLCYKPKAETFFDIRDVIAKAIMQERERCTVLARSYCVGTDAEDAIIGDR